MLLYGLDCDSCRIVLRVELTGFEASFHNIGPYICPKLGCHAVVFGGHDWIAVITRLHPVSRSGHPADNDGNREYTGPTHPEHSPAFP